MRILDESTGGFAVESEDELGCQLGDTLLLDVALCWVEVEVVSVGRQEVPQDGEASAEPIPTRIGLRRIRDLGEGEVAPSRRRLLAGSRFRTRPVPWLPLGWCQGLGTTIVAIIAAGIVLIWLMENAGPLLEAVRAVGR